MKNKYYLPLLLTLNILSISAEQKKRFSSAELAYKQYPVHEAVKADDLESLIALIESGERINTQDELGKTPLHYAMDKSIDILHTLAAAGPDFTIEDNEGKTPVDRAQEHGTTSLLLKVIEDQPYAKKSD